MSLPSCSWKRTPVWKARLSQIPSLDGQNVVDVGGQFEELVLEPDHLRDVGGLKLAGSALLALGFLFVH